MTTRYEQIYERLKHLEELDPKLVRLCPANGPCACIGCAGTVGAKIITQHEIDIYKNGRMKEITDDDSNCI